MTGQLKHGWDLIRKRQFAEAELFFIEAATHPSMRSDALGALAKITKAHRNTDLLLKYLDELVALDPKNLSARLWRARASLRGSRANMEKHKNEIEEIMLLLKSSPNQTAALYRKIHLGIQFSYSGSERILGILELLKHVNKALEENPKRSVQLSILKAEIFFALGDLNKMAKEVEKIPNQANTLSIVESLRRVAEKVDSPAYPDFNAPKIFGIGLSRTATTSLNKALIILGFNAIHMVNPHTNTIISDRDFLLFDAFTDVPVSYQFEKLYHTFPGSRFILTSRKMDSWIRSVATLYQNNRAISLPSELCQTEKARRFDGAVYPIEWALYGQYNTWQDAYSQFEKRVNNFFSDKPENRFMELNICGGEGWAKLCPFLDKPIPDVPFPNENKGPADISKSNFRV